MQFDEKWAFVRKKPKHCDPRDPADTEQGDNWDHVAFDPTHRLVLSVVPGKRTAVQTDALVKDAHMRTGGRMLDLLVSDAYPAYKPAILHTYGETIIPPRTGKPGRPKRPYTVAPAGLQYATVPKTRHKGRVVHVDVRVVFGQEEAISAALAASPVSTMIHTAFVERHHGTDRNRNGRKIRKSLGFSKDWKVHNAVTYPYSATSQGTLKLPSVQRHCAIADPVPSSCHQREFDALGWDHGGLLLTIRMLDIPYTR